MKSRTLLVLIASVSESDRHTVEVGLAKTGQSLYGVEDAQEAASACSAHDGASVLVIDSGLLLMAHDPQWRLFRTDHPELGAVVRSLIPLGSIRRGDENTLLVHPDDDNGLCQAVAALVPPVCAAAGSG